MVISDEMIFCFLLAVLPYILPCLDELVHAAGGIRRRCGRHEIGVATGQTARPRESGRTNRRPTGSKGKSVAGALSPEFTLFFVFPAYRVNFFTRGLRIV